MAALIQATLIPCNLLLAASKFSAPDSDWLREAYQGRFPTASHETYSKEIIESVLATPSRLPKFHLALLEAFATAPDPGSRNQFFNAHAIQHVFTDNPQGKSWGGIENVLLQGLIVLALTDSDQPLQALHSIFEAMRHGLSQAALAKVIGDTPFLNEIRNKRDELPTYQYLQKLARHGYAPEQLAKQINGTRYTAYINDMRLARKVVSVCSDMELYIKEPQRRTWATNLLGDAIKKLIRLERTLGVEELFVLLQIIPDPHIRAIRENWLDRQFNIEILSPTEFNALVANWDGPPIKYSLFIQGGATQRDRIVIRQLPLLKLESHAAEQVAFEEITMRLVGLVHEAEHWRHTSGHYQWDEAASERIDLNGISYHDRMVSELMANLEEYRWRVRHLDNMVYELARRTGQTLALHFRELHEIAYRIP